MGALLEFIGDVLADCIGEAICAKARPGMCARCRKAEGVTTVAGAGDQPVCGRCANLVASNHRAGERFFLGIAVLVAAIGIIIGVQHVQRDLPISIRDVLLFAAAGVLLPGAAAWGIHLATRTAVSQSSANRQESIERSGAAQQRDEADEARDG